MNHSKQKHKDIIFSAYNVLITCMDNNLESVYRKRIPDIILRKGDFLVIRGANGSGKTTLLRQLVGLDNTNCYQTLIKYWKGIKIHDPDQNFQENFHWLGHNHGLYSILTLIEEWKFWLQFCSTNILDNKSYISTPTILTDIAKKLNLDHLFNHTIGQLSAGERQKAALGRLLFNTRPLWVLDEPDSHLDSSSRDTLYHIIKEHCLASGIAIVVSHQSELLMYATQQYIID